MTDPTNAEIGPKPWVWVTFIFAVVLVCVGTAAFLIERTAQNSTQLARQDCAREISVEQTQVRDMASSTAGAVSRYYFKAALDAANSHLPVSQAQIDTFTELIRVADQADDSLIALPDLAQEVERRCPS